jgi:flagellar biosynthesis/type III secretory pathway protein FliH
MPSWKIRIPAFSGASSSPSMSGCRAREVNQTDPRRERFDIAGLTRILADATSIVMSLRQQTQSLQRRAYMDGHAAGFARAQAETVRQALEAQMKAREFIDASEQQIVSMALACIERVASTLGPATVVTALLTDALKSIQTGRQLRVNVSQGAASATRAMLARWQQEHPRVEVEVLVDPQLEPFGCEIESELGCIELGLRKQLQAIGEEQSAAASTESK